MAVNIVRQGPGKVSMLQAVKPSLPHDIHIVQRGQGPPRSDRGGGIAAKAEML